MMKIVLKIGGSILFDDEGIRVDFIKKWINIINQLIEQDHQLGIVIGGGKPARNFSNAAKLIGASADYQDLIGIEATRQNARLFISGLADALPYVPKNYDEVLSLASSNNLIISGGFQPGQSTNAVAAIMAELMGAELLINLSNIKFVYDSDPKINESAKPIHKLNYDEFHSILNQNEQSPGKYALFDIVGLNIVKRSGIKLLFLDGNRPELVIDAIKGKVEGSIIS